MLFLGLIKMGNFYFENLDEAAPIGNQRSSYSQGKVPRWKIQIFFKYDSFERENFQYKLGNNIIGGDTLFGPTGGVKNIVFLAVAPYRKIFSKTVFSKNWS